MKICLLIIYLLLTPLSGILASPVLAGFAEADITPPSGYRLSGSYEERFADGTGSPLLAKAVAISLGARTALLLSLDLTGIPPAFGRKLREQIAAANSLQLSEIIITATHTHTAPEFEGPLRDALHLRALQKHGHDPAETIDYPEFLLRQSLAAANDALARRQPVELHASTVPLPGLPHNRRISRNQSQPIPLAAEAFDGSVDPDLNILYFTRPGESQPVGTLTTFALHPTTVRESHFHPDFPGELSLALQSHYGKGFTSIFTQGCGGDIHHLPPGPGQAPSTHEIGQTLAQAVMDAYGQADSLAPEQMIVQSHVVKASVSPTSFEANKTAMKTLANPDAGFEELVAAWRETIRWQESQAHGTTTPLEVQVLRLEPGFALVSLPQEIFAATGLAIKATKSHPHLHVVSLAHQCEYYIPPSSAFAVGDYEVDTCPLEPGAAEALVTAARSLLLQDNPTSSTSDLTP